MARPPLPSLALLTFVIGLASAAASAAADAGPRGEFPGCYLWQLSFSDTDPWDYEQPAASGPLEVYLWYTQREWPYGISAAEMTVQFPAEFQLFGFAPMNGFLNIGTAHHLLLAVGSCPWGPMVAGKFSFFDAMGGGGSVCLGAPDGGDGPPVTVDCSTPLPFSMTGAVQGCSTDPSETACRRDVACTSPTDPSSWGSVKSGYRTR